MGDYWATPSDVMSLTGVIIDDLTIMGQAQGTIDIACNRTIAVSGQISARNRQWLKYAVAYQAAFISAHPDMFTREDVQSISQDGLSVTWRPGADGTDNLILGPLTKRALSRVSWMRSRSIAVNSDFVYGQSQDRPGWFTDYSDDNDWQWTPLAGA